LTKAPQKCGAFLLLGADLEHRQLTDSGHFLRESSALGPLLDLTGDSRDATHHCPA
jgi:hypothetical protein